MKNLLIGGSVIAILSIMGVVALYSRASVTIRSEMEVELAKLLLQIIVIVFIGGIVKLLIDNASKERQKADVQRELERMRANALNEFQKRLHDQLVQIFSDTKKSRRLLRARRSAVDHDRQMELISDVQLDLETLAQEIKVAINIFSNEENLTSNIEAMAKYLNQLIDEYEHKFPKLSNKSLSMSDLKWLNDFIGRYRKSEFRKQFVHTYRLALRSLQHDLLHTNNK